MRFNKNFKFEKGRLYTIESGCVCYFGVFVKRKRDYGCYVFREFVIDENSELGELKSTGKELEFTPNDLEGANIYG